MERIRLKHTLRGGLMALLCFASSYGFALDVSVKTTGMAATGVAYPQDAEASAFNPAGTTEICDRFDAGVTYITYHGHIRFSGNRRPIVNGRFGPYHRNAKWSVSPDFGIVKRFGCDDRFAASLVVYNKSYSKTTYGQPLVLLGTTRPGLEYIHEIISPGLAYKINDCHSFGLTVNFNVTRIHFKGLQNFDNARLSSRPGHVTNRNYAYSTGVGVTLGWLGHFCDCVNLGFTFTPECKMPRYHHFSGLLAQHGRLNIPQKICAGIAVKVLPCMTFAFDIEHLSWARVKSLHNPFAPNFLTSQLGLKNGAGFGWRSQTYYRFGVDYALNDCWTVRAGYRYAKTTIPRSQTAVNLLINDVAEQYATVGATWRVNCLNEISFFYAHGFSKKIKGRNSLPPQFGGGDVDLESSKDAFAISWGRYY